MISLTFIGPRALARRATVGCTGTRVGPGGNRGTPTTCGRLAVESYRRSAPMGAAGAYPRVCSIESGGVNVVRRRLAGRIRDRRGHSGSVGGRRVGRGRHGFDVVEQVLADEGARIEVGQVEVGNGVTVFGLQLVASGLRHPAELLNRAGGVAGNFG